MLSAHGLSDDLSGRSCFRNYMKRRVLEIFHCNEPYEMDEQWRKIRRGWAYGTDEFRLKVQGHIDSVISGKRRDSYMGAEIRKHDEIVADRLLQEGLLCFGLMENDLEGLKKGDDRKKVIAWHIRTKTSVRVEWICRRLQMGVPSNFASHIRSVGRAESGPLWELRNEIMK